MRDYEKGYKNQDSKNLARLMRYAKPYFWHLAACVLMLTVIVTSDLAQPVIIGRAVDDLINHYDKSYRIAQPQEEAKYEVGEYRMNPVDPEEITAEGSYAVMLYIEDQYYLMAGVNAVQAQELLEAKGHEDTLSIQGTQITLQDGSTVTRILMDKEILKELRSDDYSGLVRLSILYIFLLVVGLVVGFCQHVLLGYVGQKIIYSIRNDLYRHVQTLNIEFFNDTPVGKLVTRLTNDTEGLNELYTNCIVTTIKCVFTLAGIIIVMVSINWKLALAEFLVMPVIAVVTFLFRNASRKNHSDMRSKLATVNVFLSEHFSGMRLVQIFAQEKQVYDQFDGVNKAYLKSCMRQVYLFGIYRPAMYLLYILGVIIVLVYGGSLVLSGVLTIGTLVVFSDYISRFFNPIQTLAEQFNTMLSAMASAEKIFSLMDYNEHIPEAENPLPLKNPQGHIEFRHVWFAYDDEQWVLKDVSFEVLPGQSAAFVGATGAGKTSILNLISRYYDIQKGEILLDGHNVKEYKISDLRNCIGQMLQDVFLFTGDISSNIRLRDQSITGPQIQEAAKYVNADAFISKLPRGYDEKVYERGATLSAGQRQLLSFARTLAFKPSILILDEATANIDTETEELIQDALKKLMKGRTTLVVAHRLSTIQHADKIIVLHKGRIQESGSHQELLAKKGMYYQLYRLQYQEDPV